MRESIKMELFQKLLGKKKIMNIATREKTVSVLVMGKAAVGKTCLIQKLVGQETFSEEHVPTLYDDLMKEVNVDEYKVTFKFMELGGTHAFPSMLEIFIQQAEMYILVYSDDDVESYNTLLALRETLVSVKKKSYSELPIIVVRNKADIRRKRSRRDKLHKKSVTNWCYLNHDVSSKTGFKVNSIMDNLIEESKFIGSKKDENNFKISGRYIYSEKNEGQSELYHKAPGMFNNPDNSDEKMNKRRIKLHNKENRLNKKNLSTSMPSLKRSLSLTSLRRTMRRFKRNPKNLPNRDEIISGSTVSLKESTRSLNIRSSTLPEKQSDKLSELNLRANTFQVNDNCYSVSDVSNSATADISVQEKRKSFSFKLNSEDRASVVMRNTSKSLYLRPRTCTSLVVPNKDPGSKYGSCLEIEQNHKNIPITVSDHFNSSASINKSLSFRGKERPRPKLCRQLSTDDCGRSSENLMDIKGSKNDIHRQTIEMQGKRDSLTITKQSIKMDSLENSTEFSQHSPNLPGSIRSPESIKDVPQISNDIAGSIRRNSPENRKEFLQRSSVLGGSIRSIPPENVTEVHGSVQEVTPEISKLKLRRTSYTQSKRRNSPDSIDDIDGSSNNIINSVNDFPTSRNKNIRASNSPQVVRRSIPVMRSESQSQNDVTDMFTVVIPVPEPKRKTSTIFKACKPNRKSFSSSTKEESSSKSTDFSLKEFRKSKDFSERKQYSDSSSSDKSYLKDSPLRKKDLTASKFQSDECKQNNETRLKRYSSEQKASFDSNFTRSQTIPMKHPLNRRRSKSSSEVRGSPNSPNKKLSSSSNSSYSGTRSKRTSWSVDRGSVDSNSKYKLKSILKHSAIESTPTILKKPLRKVDSLSHNDLRYQEKFNKYQGNSDRSIVQSQTLFQKSSMKTKQRTINQEGSPMVQAKRWLQSKAFNKSIDQ